LKQDESSIKGTRRFMSGMTNYISKKRDKEFEALWKQYQKNYEMNDNLSSIELIIERVLQKAIISPLRKSLEKCILTKTITEQNELYSKKLETILKQTQTDLGIPDEFQSTNGWVTAISKLEKIKLVETPSERLSVLFQTSNEIYKAHTFYQMDKESKKLLSGDDFLPIFVYIASKVKFENPFLMVEMTLQLGDPKIMSSEQGYYLMVFLSALNVLITL
jgi:predicted transcriptional regulator